MCVCVCACVCACVRACVRTCVRVCVICISITYDTCFTLSDKNICLISRRLRFDFWVSAYFMV